MVVHYGLSTLIVLLFGIFLTAGVGYISYRIGEIKGMMQVIDFDKKVKRANMEPSYDRYKHQYKRRIY